MMVSQPVMGMHDLLWTFGIVEDRLIEAMRFAWRDEPGRWPFASDGPWHLIRREWNDHGAHEQAALPHIPLSRAERARMEAAMGWLRLMGESGVKQLGEGGDALLIVLVTRKLASHRGEGRGRVDWMAVLRHLRVKHGAGMLAQRYSRAVTVIVKHLDKTRVPVDLARH